MVRSIPACAGEPSLLTPTTLARGVHPRVCGGALSLHAHTASHSGPSPRVRGSLCDVEHPPAHDGSIPACAGEPPSTRHSSAPTGVHPRVCGGAVDGGSHVLVAPGPSPRVRGSLSPDRSHPADIGSIPACAGEPSVPTPRSTMARVHPRVCGGAIRVLERVVPGHGPSPRVRGSPIVRPHVDAAEGSIPACAGEPRFCGCWIGDARVHPRVCGGAPSSSSPPSARRGPSPRVRGSLCQCARPDVVPGSIPACAGEPAYRYRPGSPSWVHPRVCGGAVQSCQFPSNGQGPSPRVRGSLGRRDPTEGKIGPSPRVRGSRGGSGGQRR